MNILFYSPLQSRSKDTESIMEAFVKAHHRVFLLTQYPAPIYHSACERIGVKCFVTQEIGIEGWTRKIAQIRFLVSFCKQHAIDVTYAQLEPANLIAVLAQYFVSSRVILTRHHVDEIAITSGIKARMVSILIYKLARTIVVVSNRSKEYMINVEGIRATKIFKIGLGYNFGLWPPVDHDFVQKKRQKLGGAFTIVTAARFVRSKRVHLVIDMVARMRRQNVDCRLLLLGKGEEETALRNQARQLSIDSFVHFEGYVERTLDYIASADIMVHLSIIESSASVVREAGLAGKPVIVCRGVGDFEEYIQDGVNGFLVDMNDPIEASISTISSIISQPERLNDMGNRLRKSVLENFSIESVHNEYERLNLSAV